MEAVRGWVWIFTGIAQSIYKGKNFIHVSHEQKDFCVVAV